MAITSRTGETLNVTRLACRYLWRLTGKTSRISQTVNRDQFRSITLQSYGLAGRWRGINVYQNSKQRGANEI